MISRYLQHRALALLAVIVAASLLALSPQATAAQEVPRCFPETGQCISGPIRAYWERNGGLPIFGYPISPLQTETVEGRTLPVQWFERDRLEDHGPVGVLAGRLGARLLELHTTPWDYFPKVNAAPPGCRFFAETGHSLCGPYLSYWQNNGGLERFGYPITEPFYETVETKKLQVQYFERRRMELHPDVPGSPLLLGLLGNAVRERPEPVLRYPECLDQALPNLRNVQIGKPLGCPSLMPLPDVPAATQTFERGLMLWTDIRGPSGVPPRLAPAVPPIFAIVGVDPNATGYQDTWVADQDRDTPAATPPAPGLYAPWRGFGKVWIEQPALREAIGWATEPQAQARRADIQLFANVLLIRLRENGATYAFGNTNTPGNAQVIMP
jgi:hypothetical protein